ncbi:MAG TPA: prepilin-type N-terminal cleavage/methylation domain-containing protein [Candidatus Saccharibacteria bacterium]|nr:prepilin-type N-terminal cleavage/methylation domain-containing protein [Candidatus Saccharibacteria bacterium]
MKMYHTHQSGFTTVELLIALFIAAIFLGAGHQLYNAIVQDSGEARQRAQANNIAYNMLRRYADSAPSVCTPGTAVNNTLVPNPPDNLKNVRHTITYDCPQSSLLGLTRVVVRVTYGSDAQEVVHAMYTAQ